MKKLKIWIFLGFIFFLPISSLAKERIVIYALNAKILDRPLINCEALAGYLNQKSKDFSFSCLYVDDRYFRDVKSPNFQLAIVNPPIFIHLKERFQNRETKGVFPIFNIYSYEFSREGFQGAVIFTLKDSSINSLSNLKGKTIGIVSDCASCFALSLYELNKIGIKEDHIKLKRLGSWEKVIEAVLKKEVNAGAVRTGVLEYLNKKKYINLNKIKVLASKSYPDFPFLVSTTLIPDWYLVYTREAPPKLISTLYQALSDLAQMKKEIPNSDLMVILPYEPHQLYVIMKELLIGPFFPLRKMVEAEKQRLTIIYSALILLAGFTIFYLLYLYKKNTRLNKELEEGKKILESLLEEKSTSLSIISKKFREEMKILETMFKNIDTGIALLDENGLILKANKTFQDIFEQDLKSLLGKSFKSLLKEVNCEISHDIPDKKEISETKNTIKIKIDNREKFIYFSEVALEEILKSLAIVRDITSEKKWEAEVTRYTQLETLRVIASGLAHDLNNLLSSILNNTEILHRKGSALPYKILEKLQAIKNTCLRAKSITQELLVYGKSLILSPELFSLPKFLREVTAFALAGSGIKILYFFDPRIKSIECDKNLLSIALHNILINARQAMNDKGIIKIVTELTKPYVMLGISDTGPGIPEKIKKDLFKPFITTKPGGSGLGLFSANRIIEAHGGKIEIESSPGQGTTVKIYLPYSEKEVSPVEAPQLQFSTPESKKRILLMDDEIEIRESLKELLESFDFEVITCENGEEALQLYEREGPFDAVILDLTVPGALDGIQTFYELKKMDPEVKAILATGYAYKKETLDAKALGFKEVLIKPFSLESLLEVLDNITR
jgi:PAS domain S-box-containing protein